MGAFLGIDIGGTNIKAALLSQGGSVLAFLSRSWSGGGPRDAVAAAVALSEELLGSRPGEPPEACGAGVAGLVDARQGVVRLSPNLHEWTDVELRAMLESALHLPVTLENDANAAAYGEFRIGAARGARNAVMLTLGTGVGGGIIVDGKLYRGRSFAGEIGHMTIERNGLPCPCGNRGCLERYANAEALVERAVRLLEQGRPSSLAQVHAAGMMTANDVGHAAVSGDELACEAVAETGRALGVGLASLSVLLDPEMIVLGGGVARAGPVLFDAARDEIVRRRYGGSYIVPRLVPATLAETAGAAGAALLARDEPQK